MFGKMNLISNLLTYFRIVYNITNVESDIQFPMTYVHYFSYDQNSNPKYNSVKCIVWKNTLQTVNKLILLYNNNCRF